MFTDLEIKNKKTKMVEDYYHKFVTLPSLFNNENLLEFSIEPDKRFLILGKSFIRFYVELSEDYVPDNNFTNKLFEYLDLNINYEDVNYKCSPNDYDLTSHIYNKIYRNPGYLKNIKFEGQFDNFNYDSSELKIHSDIVEKRRGVPFKKTIIVDGVSKEEKHFRYMFLMPINHGLCNENQILPAGLHVRLTFHRARAMKALVDISDSIIQYPENSIKLLDPTLNICWAYSTKLSSQMSKVNTSGLNIPFESSHVRHRVLDSGLSEHSIQIIQGKMPEMLVCFLMEPERFANESKLSSSKLERHDMTEFSLVLDNTVCENYPLKVSKYGESSFYHNFYKHWLIQTSNYGNSLENLLDESAFMNTNFMIVENFSDFEIKKGILAVKLKFNKLLDKKLYFCWVPFTMKTLKIDRNLSVQLT